VAASLINGEPQGQVTIADRSFQYGDGVFETLRVVAGRPTLWPLHLQRLQAGCDFLNIPLNVPILERELAGLLASNPANGIAKIIVSRGAGGRGYRPPEVAEPLRVLQFFPWTPEPASPPADGIEACICAHPLSQNPVLTRYKHLCRLDQVIASRELPKQFPEGIMLTDDGLVIEGTRSNIFLVTHNRLVTPSLHRAGVQGVMREYLLDRFREEGCEVDQQDITIANLLGASELFFCNSVFGVWPVRELTHSGGRVGYGMGDMTHQAIRYAQEAYREDT